VVMFGGDNRLFAVFDIDVLGENKLDAVMKKMGMVDQQARQTGQGIEMFGQETKNAGNNADQAGGQFGQMFGIGMNLMFLGMAMNMVFGRLSRQMLEMTGASAAMGAAMKTVLLPFFLAITPLLIKVSILFMKLPRPIKMAIGAFVALMTVLGIFLFFGSQIALLAISLQVSLLALAGAIATVTASLFAVFLAAATVAYIFKRFGAAAGLAAAIIGGAVVLSFLKLIGMTNLLSLALFKLTSSTAALTASMFGLQFSLSSILLVASALALSILLISRIFKKFGPIVGTLAAILTGVLLTIARSRSSIWFSSGIYGG